LPVTDVQRLVWGSLFRIDQPGQGPLCSTQGRAALEAFLASSEFDPEEFTPADHAALAGDWSWLGEVAGQALEGGVGGMVDDELAYVGPVGVCSWAGPRAGAVGARWPGLDRAQRPRPVAGTPNPLGRAVAAAR
jgi:hypothetical protein